MTKDEAQKSNENEFKAFKLKFQKSDDDSVANIIFVKKYKSESKSPDKPLGKTLQVQNIPPYATEESIKRVFEVAGEITSVNLFDKWENEYKSKYEVPTKYFIKTPPFVYKIGIIVYKKSSSVDLFLSCDGLPPLSTEEHPILMGLEKWNAEYNRRQVIDRNELQSEIDEYMKHHDKVLKEEESKQKDVDDDGWTVVSKKGQNPGFKQTPSTVNKLQMKAEKQRKGLKNFYTFELRESKKQDLMNLKRKFEEDRDKMRSMKKRKSFMSI